MVCYMDALQIGMYAHTTHTHTVCAYMYVLWGEIGVGRLPGANPMAVPAKYSKKLTLVMPYK